MDNALLVRVLHRLAHQNKESQPFIGWKLVPIAKIGDRHPIDQFHDEEWPPSFRRAGIQDLGDIWVIHSRQDLPLAFKPGDHLTSVESRLDDLERNLASNRLGLFGAKH